MTLSYQNINVVNNFIRQIASLEHPVKHKLFGVSPEVVLRTQKQNFELKFLNVPLVVRLCADEIIKNARDLEGIFRVPGAHNLITDVCNEFENGIIPNFASVGPEEVSGVFKKFLRELPHPLLSDDSPNNKLADRFAEVLTLDSPKAKCKRLRKLLRKLSIFRRTLAKEMFYVLYLVSLEHKKNLMDSANLATIFGGMVNIISDSMTGVAKTELCCFLIEYYPYIWKGIEELKPRPVLDVHPDQKERKIFHIFFDDGTFKSIVVTPETICGTVSENLQLKLKSSNVDVAKFVMVELRDREIRLIGPEEFLLPILESSSVLLFSGMLDLENLTFNFPENPKISDPEIQSEESMTEGEGVEEELVLPLLDSDKVLEVDKSQPPAKVMGTNSLTVKAQKEEKTKRRKSRHKKLPKFYKGEDHEEFHDSIHQTWSDDLETKEVHENEVLDLVKRVERIPENIDFSIPSRSIHQINEATVHFCEEKKVRQGCHLVLMTDMLFIFTQKKFKRKGTCEALFAFKDASCCHEQVFDSVTHSQSVKLISGCKRKELLVSNLVEPKQWILQVQSAIDIANQLNEPYMLEESIFLSSTFSLAVAPPSSKEKRRSYDSHSRTPAFFHKSPKTERLQSMEDQISSAKMQRKTLFRSSEKIFSRIKESPKKLESPRPELPLDLLVIIPEQSNPPGNPSQEISVHESDVHESVVHESAVHESVVHESVVQESVVHESAVHEKVVHETPKLMLPVIQLVPPSDSSQDSSRRRIHRSPRFDWKDKSLFDLKTMDLTNPCQTKDEPQTPGFFPSNLSPTQLDSTVLQPDQLEVVSVPIQWNSSDQLEVVPAPILLNPSDQLEVVPSPILLNSSDQLEVVPSPILLNPSDQLEVVPSLILLNPSDQLEVVPSPILLNPSDQLEVVPSPILLNPSDQLEVVPSPILLNPSDQLEVAPMLEQYDVTDQVPATQTVPEKTQE